MITIDFCIVVLAVALVSAFILLLLGKLGAIEWLQVHGIDSKKDSVNDLFSKWASCNFCLSFWCAVLLSAIAVAVSGDGLLMFVPILSTPITRFLL